MITVWITQSGNVSARPTSYAMTKNEKNKNSSPDPKKIPKELALELMKVSDKISLTGTLAPSEFLYEK